MSKRPPPPKQVPWLDDMPRYFLHVTITMYGTAKEGWAVIDRAAIGETMTFNSSVLHAEALTSEDALRYSNIIRAFYPHTHNVHPIRCDSKQLIPDETRKLLKWKL